MAYKQKIPKENKIYFKTYNESELTQMGKAKGLTYSQSLNFAKFMQRRFPQERDRGYIEEWIDRFKTGHPKTYMDSNSLKIYEEIEELDL